MHRNLRIGVTTFGADGGRSGIGTYLTKTLEQWERTQDRHTMELFAHRSERAVCGGSHLNTHWVTERYRPAPWNLAWHQWALPRLVRRHALDAMFLPAANRRLPWSVPCATVGTVHDIAPLQVHGKYHASHRFYQARVLPSLVRRLTRVATVSESSKRDLVERLNVSPDRISVIPNGVDHDQYKPLPAGAAGRHVEAHFGIPGPYILYVSRVEHPGKNHVRLITAFERLKSRYNLPHRLVCVGSDWTRADRVHRRVAASPYRSQIAFLGFVESGHLPFLYSGADLTAFPSLYEGFGMPVLESMACGTPVVCSNASSLPEVAGDAALLFDPHDDEAMTHAMYRVLTEPQLHYTLVDRGLAQSARFSWERSAKQTLEELERAVEERAHAKA